MRRPNCSARAVAECCGAHLRDRQAACGYDDGLGFEMSRLGCLDSKVSVAHDGENSCADDDADSCVCTLALEHGDDVVGGAVAEELSECLFVVAEFRASRSWR